MTLVVVSSHPNGGARETGDGLDQPCFLETDWQIGAAFLLSFGEQENKAVKTGIEPSRIQSESQRRRLVASTRRR